MRRVYGWLALCLILFASRGLRAGTDPACFVHGMAYDDARRPLAGVTITLRREGGAPRTYQATSEADGAFNVMDVAPGEYTVAGGLAGYVGAAPRAVHISSTTVDVATEVTLKRSTHSEPEESAGAGSTKPAPALEFQASGLHGLIDQGGYSASTSGAASGLVEGMATLQRTDQQAGQQSAVEPGCDLEPALVAAVAQRPEEVEPNRRLGGFYVFHDEPAKAIPYLTKAMALSVGSAATAGSLANAYVQAGEFARARVLLAPVAAHSEDATVHQTLARAEEGCGLFLQAAREYRISDRESPSEKSVFGAGYELILAGAVEESVATFQEGLARYPRSVPLLIGVSVAWLLEGRTADGIRGLLDATDIDPSDPRAYPFLASASEHDDTEKGRVRNSFKRFVEREPGSGEANYFYALALSRDGTSSSDQIETVLKRSLQLQPGSAQAHLLLGIMAARRADYGAAATEYDDAVRLDPELGEAHYRLSLAYKREGRLDASTREAEVYRLQQARGSSAQGKIDLGHFVSVMNPRDGSRAREGACPGSRH